jgi:hypothetical protein
MGKSNLLKDRMKGGLNGLLSSTTSSSTEDKPAKSAKEKETVVHCNFLINKSVHTRMKYLAVDKDMPLKDIVNEAMLEYLDKHEKK